MPTLSSDVLTDLSIRLFEAAGVSREEAQIVSAGLVGANLRGHDSHGVMRIPQYIGFVENGDYRPGAELKIVHETPAVVVADGGWGFGQVQAHRLLDRVLPKAMALGIASGAAQNLGHTGRLGEYAERAAAEGLTLFATANNAGAGQRVAPPGGIAPRLGTNPLCIGVPTRDGPIILDFGTCVVAEGKVRVFHINMLPVPEGWLLDCEGNPTTDPAAIYATPPGSILPMGGAQGYKGFGLALVLDMLAGGLTGGRSAFAGAPPARGNNLVFLALDPAQFAGRDALLREATQLATYVRETPRAKGVDAILLPGDPERVALQRRQAEGIPLTEAHWNALMVLANRLSVALPHSIEPIG